MKNDPSNRPTGILCYDNCTFGFEPDLFIYSIIQQLLVPLYHRTMAQKIKMINIQWLTNSDIYRSKIKNLLLSYWKH